MSTNQWFRSWHGAPTDPKWLGIARKAGVAPGIVAALVWALLDRASQAAERGSIAGYDADGLGCFFGCEADQVEAVIKAMHDKGVLENDAFAGWSKHQPMREDGASERGKAYRERKRTQENATEQERTLDTDTDTDTETETEREREGALAQVHQKIAQGILGDKAFKLSTWEDGFLCTVAAVPKLSPEQQSTFDAIAKRWAGRQPNAPPPPKQVRVIEGSEAWAAWQTVWQRSKGKPLPITDLKDDDGRIIGKRGWYFPSEFPEQKGAAA